MDESVFYMWLDFVLPAMLGNHLGTCSVNEIKENQAHFSKKSAKPSGS